MKRQPVETVVAATNNTSGTNTKASPVPITSPASAAILATPLVSSSTSITHPAKDYQSSIVTTVTSTSSPSSSSPGPPSSVVVEVASSGSSVPSSPSAPTAIVASPAPPSSSVSSSTNSNSGLTHTHPPLKPQPVIIRPQRFPSHLSQQTVTGPSTTSSTITARPSQIQVPTAFTVTPRSSADGYPNRDGPRPIFRRAVDSGPLGTSPVIVTLPARNPPAGKGGPGIQFPVHTVFATVSRPSGASVTMAPLNAANHSSQSGGVSVVHSVGSGPTVVRTATLAPRPLNSANPSPSIRTKAVPVTPPVPVPPPSPSPSLQNPQFQRLKVEDALSYLDQVKYKFGNQPHVYNDFLDIMKEFKSQSLDTPGVIERVSSLFKGHPELIVGFNTFLPPGYKIEVTTTEQSGCQATGGMATLKTTTLVHTPEGVHRMSHTSQRAADKPSIAPVHHPRVASVADATAMLTMSTSISATERTTSSPALPGTGGGALIAATVATGPQSSGSTVPQGQPTALVVVSSPHVSCQVSSPVVLAPSPGVSMTMTTTTSCSTGTSTQGPDSPAIGANSNSLAPLEFNHAISYVNKIKLRFQHRPEVYKQFLEILHTYQKEQKEARMGNYGARIASAIKLNEAEVFKKVARLFENQDDLLQEFSQFLPEATGCNVPLATKMMNDHGSLSLKGIVATGPASPAFMGPSTVTSGAILATTSHPQPLPPPTAHQQPIAVSVASSVNHEPSHGPGSTLIGASVSTVSQSATSAFNSVRPKSSTIPVGSSVMQPPQNHYHHPVPPPESYHPVHHEAPARVAQLAPIPPPSAHQFHTQPHHATPISTQTPPHTGPANNQPKPPQTVGNKKPASDSATMPPPSSIKRPIPPPSAHAITGQPPIKKLKLAPHKDVSVAEAAKFGSLKEFSLFDKLRKTMNDSLKYQLLLRMIALYNLEIVSKNELMTLLQDVLGNTTEMAKWVKDFIKHPVDPLSALNNNVTKASAGLSTPSVLNSGYSKSASSESSFRRMLWNKSLQNAGGTPGAPASEAAVKHEGPAIWMNGRGCRYNERQLDFSNARRVGASYCEVPENRPQEDYSNYSNVSQEVINHDWVSFPSWSEDSTFVSQRKTQFEEYIYRCEDERYELDMLVETNWRSLGHFESVMRRIQRLPAEERSNFELGETLGDHPAPALLKKAVERLYGRDKVTVLMDAARRKPAKTLPILIQRMKEKDEEWRDARKGFLKSWREQNEKYHYKAMDHQGINFKQTDGKKLRSKALLSEIETLYDNRNEQAEKEAREPDSGPHMRFRYGDRCTLEDVASLLMHHVKRQTAAASHKEDRRRIRKVIEQFLPLLFFRQPKTSGKNDEEEEEEEANNDKENKEKEEGEKRKGRKNCVADSGRIKKEEKDEKSKEKTGKELAARLEAVGGKNGTASSLRAARPFLSSTPSSAPVNSPSSSSTTNPAASQQASSNVPPREVHDPKDCPVNADASKCSREDEYRLFMCNNYWYVFMRLHHMLCERLTYIYQEATKRAEEAEAERIQNQNAEPVAEALGLRPKREIGVEDYYVAFLDMVKSLMDNSMEATAFEETLREMFSTRAYHAFTVDKIIVNAVRQLLHISQDPKSQDMMKIFEEEQARGGVGGLSVNAALATTVTKEYAYQKRVESELVDQNCFKFILTKDNLDMTIELLDTDTVTEWEEEEEEKEKKTVQSEKWQDYVDKYLDDRSPMEVDEEATATASSSSEKPTSDESKSKPATERKVNGEKVEKKKGGDKKANGSARLESIRTLLYEKPLFLARNARAGKARNCDRRITKFDEATVPKVDLKRPASMVSPSSSASSASEKVKERDATDGPPAKKRRSEKESMDTSEPMDKTRSTTSADDSDSVNKGSTTSAAAEKAEMSPSASTPASDASKAGTATAGPSSAASSAPGTQPADPVDGVAGVSSGKRTMKYLLYRPGSLQRARELHQNVSQRLNGKFRTWHKEWSKEKVSEENQRICSDWLLGKMENVRPHRIKVVTLHDLKKPPYSPYNRYRVDWQATSSSSSST